MSTALAQRGDGLARAFGGAPGQYVLIRRGRAAVIVVDTVRLNSKAVAGLEHVRDAEYNG
jgi:hypothetical protein